MQFVQGNNLPRIKASNQSLILQMIYHCGPIKRAEIAEALDLTLPTITTNVHSMIVRGLAREVDGPEYPPGNRGRKARPVDIVPDSQHFIGIEMQGRRRVLCVLDFRGRMVYACKDDEPRQDYAENIALSCDMIKSALQAAGLSLSDISGIGLCVPGLVDGGTGTLKAWPSYGWQEKNIRADVAALTGYNGPISVENNACARAYGVRLSQRELLNETRIFAYLFLSHGIACPLFLNTASTFGSVVGVGEVGHMVMVPNGLLCSCGNRGCLEAYSSDTAILNQCAELMAQGGAPLLRRRCSESCPPNMDLLLEAQADGDADVCRVIENAVRLVGVAAANLIKFACPRIMFIDGKLFQTVRNRDLFLSVIHCNMCNVVHIGTEFIFIEPDEFSGARGAAALSICKNLQTYKE